MNKQYISSLLLFLLVININISLSAKDLTDKFFIIPKPVKMEMTGGKGFNPVSLKQIFLSGHFKKPVLGQNLEQLLTAGSPGPGILTLRLETSAGIPESLEGYILTITGKNIEIVSRGEAGLFYGCQTLEQMMEDALKNKTELPACKITDYPAMSYRAVHFDVKHHLDHQNYYYESIDRLARYKINAIVFEFEDKLRYQRQPLVGAPQAISIDEMAALTKYARERHIEITPLVQGLGHASFILKHQAYRHLRELPWNTWAFCPLHEGTYQVLFDLYRDAIDATPGSKYLHIGGDEIGNIGLCPRCKPMADKEGMMALNLYWLKRVCEFAEQNGRIPIFWDDMPFNHAGVYKNMEREGIDQAVIDKEWKEGSMKLDQLLDKFPKNCVYMRWNYTMARQPGNLKALEWYGKRNLNVMVATAANSGGGTLFPADDRDKGMSSLGVAAIHSFLQLAAEKKINGMLCTAWDDASPHMETYWRGFIASAEYSWSPNSRQPDEFDEAYLRKEFGAEFPGYSTFYNQLRDGTVFWYNAFFRKGGRLSFGNALRDMPQLAHWLPPVEKPEKIDFSERLIELPDLKSPGSWSKKYEERLRKATDLVSGYKNTSAGLVYLLNSSHKNRYQWELYMAMNDFQLTAPALLLALKNCDSSDKEQQQSGIRNVEKVIADFDEKWSKLKEVYSKTRFLANPPDYLPDPYFHYASQREDLTWMIQPEEMFHRMVQNWIKEHEYN
jgi:hexosaminidase